MILRHFAVCFGVEIDGININILKVLVWGAASPTKYWNILVLTVLFWPSKYWKIEEYIPYFDRCLLTHSKLRTHEMHADTEIVA